MNKKISFLGCGNMAQAMINGVVKAKLVDTCNVMATDFDVNKTNYIKEALGISTSNDNIEAVNFADIIVLCVKPQHIKSLLTDIKNTITNKQTIVSIAAGVDIKLLESLLGDDKKIVRVMPNTPALVGEGASALCKNENVTEEEFKEVIDIFSSFGVAEVVTENLIDAVVGVSGSSPAFVYMFIEALADGAVLEGLPRDKAIKMAAQAVLGSAKMVLETGEHPGKLKDNVCSPAGTTIEAVYALEKNNFRGTVIEAVHKAAEKNRNM